ncbi:MAG: SpoIIE family protein phosphatase [Burkholderiaceae bacterium]|nr:SpoIIE family protein phosphatase [Burkholderiaceae bacterium]
MTVLTITRSTIAPRAAPEKREHYLVAIQGTQTGRRLRFGPEPITVGRKLVCDFVLPDAEVSSRHCQVTAHSDEADALVTDLQSTNGSFVEGKRVSTPTRLPNGGLLQLGRNVLKHEYRLPSELAQSLEMDRDLEKACSYVKALLPAPIREGPVRTDWFFLPSAMLGGDAFGYQQLDEETFAGYVVDVSGHGAGAAMHSVSVMNVLRQRALPNTDFRDPGQVLHSLNTMFQMDSHGGMYFSIWYGVYEPKTRLLRYSSAGHHPSYLAQPSRQEMTPLQTRNLMIGAMPEAKFISSSVEVLPGSVLYVFSDGVFEVVTKEGTQWGLQDFLPLLQRPAGTEVSEPERLYRAVQEVARPGALDDDFSMLVVTFV